jgi:hypothetical protein
MEKLKRSPSKRPYLYLLLIAVIFILGFALGIFALDTFRSSQNATGEATFANAQANQSCAPTSRVYAEPTAIAVDDVYMQSTNVVGRQSTGSSSLSSNAPAATSVALMNVSTTATPLAQQVYATPSPSANLATGGNSNNTAYIAPTINGPATYTPMPMGTQPVAMLTMGISTANPQGQGGGGNVSSPVELDTELRNPLSAGEIDDNAEWDVYLTYRENFHASPAYASPVDDVDVSERQLIRVVNGEFQPILGAYVEILNTNGAVIHSSCTYATGYTLFFPTLYEDAKGLTSFRARVSKDEASVEIDFELSDEAFVLELNVEQENPKLDLLFLIDASGSMDDEIAQLTNNILYISEQIDALPDEVDVRYALVSYKDGNYPTQVWDFTSDVNLFQRQLASLYTAGGDGETLNDGLDRTVNQVHWRGDDTAKLVFLVGDEPPGIYANHPSYAISMMQAGSFGIKVHPIASSGLDVQGEYIFRQIAQATMGSFIFLSYDNGATAVQETGSVEGSTGNEAFGEYTVESLDEIVLELIQDELAAGHSEQ